MVKSSSNSSTFTMINVSLLNIDPEAQRKLAPGWVKAHIPIFDVDQLGYVVVNKRANGKFYVVDGQHRVELIRAVGWGDQKIHAELFEGLTQEEEARLFGARNDRRAVRKFDKFRISVTAGDPNATAIERIVREAGLKISDQSTDGQVCAVDALERIYAGGGIASAKEGPKALARTLRTISAAWGKQAASFNGAVMLAIGLVFIRYNGQVDEMDLAKKLAPIPGGAPGLLGKGRSQKELGGRSVHHCIASIVVNLYNKGRRTGKVEGWES